MPPKPRPKPRVPSTGKGGVQQRTLVIALTAAALVAIVAIVLSLVLSGGKKKATPPPTVNADISAVAGIPQAGMTLGRSSAKVTLTEYIDTSCPICMDYVVNTFPGLSQQYVRTGKVKVAARVLAFVGPSSERGRQLVLAAARQNKAWQLLELIYHNQGDETQEWLTDDLVRAFAAKIQGLDVTRLLADADSAAVANEAAEMDSEGQTDNINGTPTFVLTTSDGVRHMLGSGNPGIDAFRESLDKALAG